MRITAQCPAWLPSQTSSPSLISPSAKAVSQLRETEALRAGTTSTKSRKASKSEAFQAFCGSLGKTELSESQSKYNEPGERILSSSWSAPPLATGRSRDPVLDDVGSASPCWDGWSFKRQGLASQSQAANDQRNDNILGQEYQRLHIFGNDGSDDDLDEGDVSHSCSEREDDVIEDDIFHMEEDTTADDSFISKTASTPEDPDEIYATVLDKNLKQLQGKHAAAVLRERTGSF